MLTTEHPVQDWSELKIHEPVNVFERGKAGYMAAIDAKTSDSSVVWIITEQGFRRAFDAREGILLVPALTKTRPELIRAFVDGEARPPLLSACGASATDTTVAPAGE